MQRTVNLLRGFAKISVECPFPERFLNLCAHNGIAFWALQRIDGLRTELTIPARDIPKAEEFAARLGGSMSVLRRQGVLFFLTRFKRRYALLAGLVVCAAALLVSGRFIWDFSVEGHERLAPEEILEALREVGVTLGTSSSSIDIETIRNHMLLKLDDLIWISVNVTGSHASVVVRERAEKPEIFSRNTPTNVIAEKAGVIERIDTLAGSAQVFAGDTVEEGQLLVSGLVDSNQVGVRLINARAEVTARTWSELNAVAPSGAMGKNYTGRSKKRASWVFGGYRVGFKSSPPYAMYDKTSRTAVFRITSSIVFPIARVVETYTEYEPTSHQMAEDVAQDYLRAALEEQLRNSTTRGNILSEQFTFRTEPGLYSAVLTAECYERIDVLRKVDLADTAGRLYLTRQLVLDEVG